jgi:hypothetical protein
MAESRESTASARPGRTSAADSSEGVRSGPFGLGLHAPTLYLKAISSTLAAWATPRERNVRCLGRPKVSDRLTARSMNRTVQCQSPDSADHTRKPGTPRW